MLVLTPLFIRVRGMLILRNSHPAPRIAPIPGQAVCLCTGCHSATPRRRKRATINQKVGRNLNAKGCLRVAPCAAAGAWVAGFFDMLNTPSVMLVVLVVVVAVNAYLYLSLPL